MDLFFLLIINIDLEIANEIFNGNNSTTFDYLSSLRENTFINDDIINSALKLASNGKEDIFIFSSFFYTKLVFKNEIVYDEVKRYFSLLHKNIYIYFIFLY